MLTYIRCVRANFYAKVGFVLFFAFGISLFVLCCLMTTNSKSPPVTFVIFLSTGFLISNIVLLMTGFGFDTFQAYKRTRRALRRYGIGYIRENILGSGYCGEVGVALAIEDAKNADT